MGAELEAARSVIYSRLLADATFNAYVSGRINVDEAPQGEAFPYATYGLVPGTESPRVPLAKAQPLFTPLRFRIMVWNKTRSYAALSTRADRIPVLFSNFSTTSGSYKFFSVLLGPHDERDRQKAGETYLGSGYDILCFLYTGSFVPAAASYLAFGNSGSEINLSPYMSRVAVRQGAKLQQDARIDQTYGQAAPLSWYVLFELTGPFTAGVDNALRTFIGATGKTVIWGPEGNAAGKARYSSPGAFIYKLDHESLDGETEPVTYTLGIAVSGGLTLGSF